MTDTAQERVEDWTDEKLAEWLDNYRTLRRIQDDPHKQGNKPTWHRALTEIGRRLRARQREEGEGRLEQIADVIRHAENRAMATDGPVSKTSDVITEEELRRIYELATATPQREGEREPVRFVGVTTQSFPDGDWLQAVTADGRLYQWNGAEWQELTDGPLYTEPPAQRDLDDG